LDIYTGQYSTKISIIYSKPHHICRIVCRIHLIRYITVVDITISYILVHVYVVRTYIQVNSTKISIIYSKPHHICRIVCRIHLIRYITVVDITISYILVHVYVVRTYIQVNSMKISIIYSKPHHTCRIVCRIHLIRYITVVDITISYILVHVYVVRTYIQVNSMKISIIYSKPHHTRRIVCRIHLVRYITVVDITISYILVHVYVVRTYIQVNSTKISIIYSKPHHICRIVCRIHLIRYITVV